MSQDPGSSGETKKQKTVSVGNQMCQFIDFFLSLICQVGTFLTLLIADNCCYVQSWLMTM